MPASGAAGRLAGKTALVTGAARGLGRAIASRFIDEGADVVITDIDSEAGEATARALGAVFQRQDVSDEQRWEQLMATFGERGQSLDVLVNNAGYAPVDGGLNPENIDLDQARKIFDVNVYGTVLGCKYGIQSMKADGGSIVNLSSIAGLVPVPFITAYGAAKAAVRHLTTSVALYCAQQGYRIRCNSIHPGQIRTDMHSELLAETARQQGASVRDVEDAFRQLIPMGEYGDAEDVADAALFLASDESRHVTGDRILVDGGMMLSN